jgi:hypothetical protein
LARLTLIAPLVPRHHRKLLRAGELTAVWVPDERHETMRDLSRARLAAHKDLRGKRRQIMSMLLRPGRIYPGKKTWGPAHIALALPVKDTKAGVKDTRV